MNGSTRLTTSNEQGSKTRSGSGSGSGSGMDNEKGESD